jgi:hypothetical protein
MWFNLFEHANSSLVPGFNGVGMGSCFFRGTLTVGTGFVGMVGIVMGVYIVWVEMKGNYFQGIDICKLNHGIG